MKYNSIKKLPKSLFSRMHIDTLFLLFIHKFTT